MNRRGHLLFNSLIIGLVAAFLLINNDERWIGISVSLFIIGLFTISSVVGEYYFSPDLDTYSGSYTAWGPLRVIWLPYQILWRHRGESHSLTGTFTRFIYLTFILTIITWFIGGVGLLKTIFAGGLVFKDVMLEYYSLALAISGGLLFSDILHLIADW